MQADPSQTTRTHTMFEFGLTFSDKCHSTVAPGKEFLLEMVVPSTFDAHPGFFISDTEEEDQGMAKNRRACSNCGCTAHSTPIMRRGPNCIRSLCNACGLWYGRRGTTRPVVPQALAPATEAAAPAAGKGVVSEIEATSVVQAIAATCSLVKKSRPSRLRVVVRPRPRSQRNQVVTDGLPRRRRGHCLSYHLRHSHHSEHVIC
jgi:hypothetical protein